MNHPLSPFQTSLRHGAFIVAAAVYLTAVRRKKAGKWRHEFGGTCDKI